jgi:adenylylsulfate kinase-like enzyme
MRERRKRRKRRRGRGNLSNQLRSIDWNMVQAKISSLKRERNNLRKKIDHLSKVIEERHFHTFGPIEVIACWGQAESNPKDRLVCLRDHEDRSRHNRRLTTVAKYLTYWEMFADGLLYLFNNNQY